MSGYHLKKPPKESPWFEKQRCLLRASADIIPAWVGGKPLGGSGSFPEATIRRAGGTVRLSQHRDFVFGVTPRIYF